MDVRGHHLSWSSLSLCAVVVVGAVLGVGVLGFGVAPWLIFVGGFCVVMMGSMVWMMVAMGKNALRRH